MKVKIMTLVDGVEEFIQISGPKEKNLIILTIPQACEVARDLRVLLRKEFGKRDPGLAEQIKDEE
jgi:hypothetical protein